MNLKINKQKFEIFLKVVSELNKENIIPILYGSLGLNKIIGEFRKANDVDLLIPNNFLINKWKKLIEIMNNISFQLKDEHEHEFVKNREIVAFGKESDLSDLGKIDPNSLKISNVKGIKFKELTAKQYLLCYQQLCRDQYRQEKRGKADQKKINLIKKYLDNQKKQDYRKI